MQGVALMIMTARPKLCAAALVAEHPLRLLSQNLPVLMTVTLKWFETCSCSLGFFRFPPLKIEAQTSKDYERRDDPLSIAEKSKQIYNLQLVETSSSHPGAQNAVACRD
jgi:hypothetical protein